MTWVMWNLVSVRLETVSLSVQDRCTVYAKRTIGSEIILDTMMVHVKAQEEAHFGPFGDSAKLDSRYEHSLRRTYHRLRNHFGCTRWNSKVTGSCGTSF